MRTGRMVPSMQEGPGPLARGGGGGRGGGAVMGPFSAPQCPMWRHPSAFRWWTGVVRHPFGVVPLRGPFRRLAGLFQNALQGVSCTIVWRFPLFFPFFFLFFVVVLLLFHLSILRRRCLLLGVGSAPERRGTWRGSSRGGGRRRWIDR